MGRLSAALLVAMVDIAGLLTVRVLLVRGHLYLMEPPSRNFYYSSAFQDWDFEYITYCPHCYQSRGPDAVRARAEANTPADVLSDYGNGAWPLRTAYDRGELAANGNFLETDEISVRHGICGDPEQTAAEGSNVFGRENSNYPVLKTYQEGSVIEMKVVVSTYHNGHLEYFICNSDDLEDGEDSPVVQSCFNMYPLTRVEDDSDASPIDNNHPGRYYVDPPCRESETDQTKPEGSASGYVVTGRYQLPEGLTCERCIVQMVHYTGNSCTQPGYEFFDPVSVPSGCASLASDWVNLDPSPCGVGDAYPEEYWNCADISITSDGSSGISFDDSTYEVDPTPAPVIKPDTPSPMTPSPVEATTAFDTPSPAISFPVTPAPAIASPVTPAPAISSPVTPAPPIASPVTPAPAISFHVTPAPEIPPSPVDPTDDDADGECTNPAGAYQQCGGSSWTGSTCCCPGYECTPIDEHYHQCQPAPHEDDSCSYFWEQCGGIAWNGPTCCSSGTECVKRDDWYYQCVPRTC